MCPLAVPAESEGVEGWGSEEPSSQLCSTFSAEKQFTSVIIMRPHNNPGNC